MKSTFIVFIVVIFTFSISCYNNKNKQDSASSEITKNQISNSLNTNQIRDSISGKGTQAIPLKLKKGVVIFDLTVENNYYDLNYSLGVKEPCGIKLNLKSGNGEVFKENLDAFVVSYNGSKSFTIDSEGDYVVDITVSSLATWTLKVK
jgi:hypothetical protein